MWFTTMLFHSVFASRSSQGSRTPLIDPKVDNPSEGTDFGKVLNMNIKCVDSLRMQLGLQKQGMWAQSTPCHITGKISVLK